MSFKGLDGKVAVVTGGAVGIGAATVERLIEEGTRVVAVDLTEEILEPISRRFPADLLAVCVADIASEAGCEVFVRTAVERFGGLHCLVNNAGVRGQLAPLHELPVAEFDRVMAVNARGVFLCLAAALRQMVAQNQGGSIVNISSLNALRANFGRTAYNTSKHAVLGLTMTAAIEYGPHGIRVNAILPGSVATDMGALADQSRATAGWRMDYTLRPIARKAAPSEIASFIAYLLSDEASFQTGTAYPIDGGAMA